MKKSKTATTKIDLQKFAQVVAEFGGLNPSQAAGLAVLFGIVEKTAFCDGVKAGRSGRYGVELDDMYSEYVTGVEEIADGDVQEPESLVESL